MVRSLRRHERRLTGCEDSVVGFAIIQVSNQLLCFDLMFEAIVQFGSAERVVASTTEAHRSTRMAGAGQANRKWKIADTPRSRPRASAGICLAMFHGAAPRCCRRLAGRSFSHESSHYAGKMPGVCLALDYARTPCSERRLCRLTWW